MPKRTHSKLPADYMPLLILATVISIAAALISSIELLTIAIRISAAVGLYLFVRDTVQMLDGVGFIGRFASFIPCISLIRFLAFWPTGYCHGGCRENIRSLTCLDYRA